MKRLTLVLLLASFALPLALPLAAGASGVRRQDGEREHRDLVITRAIYGNGKRRHNITAALNADIHDGRIRLAVNNDTMGGDPAKDKPKQLTVSYTFNGRPYQVILNENDFLDLPRPEDYRR